MRASAAPHGAHESQNQRPLGLVALAPYAVACLPSPLSTGPERSAVLARANRTSW